MQQTWSGLGLANAYHQPAYRKQTVDDVGKLPFVKRQQFAAFQLSREEVRRNSEHEKRETEAEYIKRGVHAFDLEIGILSIFPEEKVTERYPPGYGPPLGDDWPNRDDEHAEVLVPEKPEQFVLTNQELPTTPLSTDNSDPIRVPQAPRRNGRREAQRKISLEEEI